ncbi:thioredoxin-dependent thiol peroxidase [Candidatus Woesearchaeota archaeon CG10_big_fil_rev_8_21_14_0_10_37_12]|nr:MAG: thioredoxin-dependent thiol peroxidase [Candidatus Woesearchaeota archaeon CG10_big_fil_rev_8_21_14_0_10_37_12]
MLKTGDKIKDFELPDQNGKLVKLSDFKDKTIIIYFYPKDMTPGCTAEACSFRDNFSKLKKKSVVVIGISKDSEKSHQKFIEKYDLPFTLLSDPDAKVIKAFGAWGKKKFMGREFDGILRSTFVIKNNKIIKVYDKVNCTTHAEDLLKDL